MKKKHLKNIFLIIPDFNFVGVFQALSQLKWK